MFALEFFLLFFTRLRERLQKMIMFLVKRTCSQSFRHFIYRAKKTEIFISSLLNVSLLVNKIPLSIHFAIK